MFSKEQQCHASLFTVHHASVTSPQGNAAYVACLLLLCQGSEWLNGKSVWLVFRSWVRIPAGSQIFFLWIYLSLSQQKHQVLDKAYTPCFSKLRHSDNILGLSLLNRMMMYYFRANLPWLTLTITCITTSLCHHRSCKPCC